MHATGGHGAQVTLRELLAQAEADPRGGALWRLEGAARQLDANVIRLRPGARVDEHVEPDLDVLLHVVAGGGTLVLGGVPHELAPGFVALLPRGEARALAAGPDGLAHLTVHRRRPGLAIGSLRTARDEGGEAPCLLPRVCPACDRVAEDASAFFCGRCGGRLPERGTA